MSISVKKLYKNSITLYKMKLLAGENGLNNSVGWVHILEELNVSHFLEGEELVFTCGLKSDSEEWFFQFVQNLVQAGASALVVNIGDYIREISPEILLYCDEHDFPLFTIPWETRMVEMTKDFCQRIMHNEEKEQHEATAMKNILFGSGKLEDDMAALVRYGYPRLGCYNFLVISGKEHQSETEWERLKTFAEKTARFTNDNFMSFSYDQNRILVLVDYSAREQAGLIYDLTQSREAKRWNLRIGVGSMVNGLELQKDNFQNALSALELAERLDKRIIYYDDLGIYKLLMDVKDTQKLNDYYEDTIGKLEKYDEENDTRLVEILHTYLLNNGSPNLVSEKLYLHRNTVNNQLKKIQKLTGYNPLELEDKLKLFLGFYIRNIM